MNALMASECTKSFHDQVQVLTKNMSSLNTIYELELQRSNNHLKALNSFYGNLTLHPKQCNQRSRCQKSTGANCYAGYQPRKLNQVYGDMLTAMQLK